MQNWTRQTCNVFVFTCIKHLFKWRDVLHIECLEEKMINHIVLYEQLSLMLSWSNWSLSKFVLPGKLKDFWNFKSFLVTKTSTCSKLFFKKKKKALWTLFYGRGSTVSRPKRLQGGSLLFTTKFPEIPGTHFIYLRKMKS